MRELINLMQEIFLLKEEKSTIGLYEFKKKQRRITTRKKKTEKDVKLSELMRRKTAAS